MRVALIAGLSRPHKEIDYLKGTLFDRSVPDAMTLGSAGRAVALHELGFRRADQWVPLLRPYSDNVPHLTTSTVAAILESYDIDYVSIPLETMWDDNWDHGVGSVDALLLSTTFICNAPTLALVAQRIRERHPVVPLIVGGQYSNLKYRAILEQRPEIDYILRGDGEEAIAQLLRALDGKCELESVPNLVARVGGDVVASTRLGSVDIDAYPSPRFRGHWPIVPYESMRGCPFTCRFCSYPAASPQWRYKSARKIVDDWARYRDDNGARHIKAMDSTFTVPHARMREFLRLMPGSGLSWEAYTRANVVDTEEVVEAYERSGCSELSIGFESMSDKTLENMDKRVRAKHNRRAAALLAKSDIRLRICVMVGYPGESVDEYRHTHDFLVDEFEARCMLSPFSFIDETMPVWDDIERFGVEFTNPDDIAYGWRHSGVDVNIARDLLTRTLDELRWKNETGVMLLWQMDYQTPLVPHLGDAENRRIEKLIERLAFVPKEFSGHSAVSVAAKCLAELAGYGIELSSPGLSPAAPRPTSSIWIDFI